MNWYTLLTVSIGDGQLTIGFGPILILLFLAIVGILIWKRNWLWRFKSYDIVKVELPLLGKVEIKPDYQTSNVAFQIWIEMVTRKVVLPFDEHNDVIIEVYNSWYELFKEVRRLIKTLPAHKIRGNKDCNELVDVTVRLLNNVLRPHLTKWQARFRKWYSKAVEGNAVPPQDVQKTFPEYQDLVKGIKSVNDAVVAYAKMVHKVATGKDDI